MSIDRQSQPPLVLGWFPWFLYSFSRIQYLWNIYNIQESKDKQSMEYTIEWIGNQRQKQRKSMEMRIAAAVVGGGEKNIFVQL